MSNREAVRNDDAKHMDFTSIPMVGLLAVARTAGEGAAKYGRWNYLLGMKPSTYLNRIMRHYALYCLGDRSEPHLAHAAWNALALVQCEATDEEMKKDFLQSWLQVSDEQVSEMVKTRERWNEMSDEEKAEISNWSVEGLVK